MREIKFKYVFQHEETGRILALIFTLDEIQAEEFEDRLPTRYRLIDRLQYIGITQGNDEFYESDVCEDNEGNKFIIKWCSGAFVAYYFEIDEFKPISKVFTSDVKKLGNIYNIPELWFLRYIDKYYK